MASAKNMDAEELVAFIKQENEQTRRHFDVVAESLRSEIQIVAEGVMGANETLDRHEAKLDAIDGRLITVETKLDAFIGETRASFEEVRAAIV